jgi:hypothetical protein
VNEFFRRGEIAVVFKHLQERDQIVPRVLCRGTKISALPVGMVSNLVLYQVRYFSTVVPGTTKRSKYGPVEKSTWNSWPELGKKNSIQHYIGFTPLESIYSFFFSGSFNPRFRAVCT